MLKMATRPGHTTSSLVHRSSVTCKYKHKRSLIPIIPTDPALGVTSFSAVALDKTYSSSSPSFPLISLLLLVPPPPPYKTRDTPVRHVLYRMYSLKTIKKTRNVPTGKPGSS